MPVRITRRLPLFSHAERSADTTSPTTDEKAKKELAAKVGGKGPLNTGGQVTPSLSDAHVSDEVSF